MFRYVADLAEVPTVRERSRIEARGGLGPYAAATAAELAGDLVISVDGRRAPLEPAVPGRDPPPGRGRPRDPAPAAWYRAALPPGLDAGPHRVTVRDETFAGRLGWREVVVRASSGAMVGAGAPTADRQRRAARLPGGAAVASARCDRGRVRVDPRQGPARSVP